MVMQQTSNWKDMASKANEGIIKTCDNDFSSLSASVYVCCNVSVWCNIFDKIDELVPHTDSSH